MMRVCHLDTCPVGVATQNPELRKRFSGRPEFVVTFFAFLAEEVREYLAALGFRTLGEAVGHVELLDTAAAVEHWKAAGLDLAPVLHVPGLGPARPARVTGQDHGLDHALDNTLIQLAEARSPTARRCAIELPVRNVNRTVGHHARLRGRPAGTARPGLPDDTIDIALPRLGGPVVRRVPAPGHDAPAGRRRQRLSRQGTVRRADHRRARARGAAFAPSSR